MLFTINTGLVHVRTTISNNLLGAPGTELSGRFQEPKLAKGMELLDKGGHIN